MTSTIIFITLAAILIIAEQIHEKHIEDDSWGKIQRHKQQVAYCYCRLMIRHRTPYAEIGCPARR